MTSWDVSDPHDRAILSVARTWGVSPSRFMGESKPQLVQHIPNGDSIITETEEWTFDDRQAAMDLAVYESECCSGCGQPLAETSDPDKEFGYIAELPPVRCHRCTASELAQDTINNQFEGRQPGALSFNMRLREEVKPDVRTESGIEGSSDTVQANS